jgi:hypothetical protein
MRHICTLLLCLVASSFAFGQDSKADLFGGYPREANEIGQRASVL